MMNSEADDRGASDGAHVSSFIGVIFHRYYNL